MAGTQPQTPFRIFVNYRRSDAPDSAGRIYDQLSAHFGLEHVFIDVDNVPLGDDFVQLIERELQSCQVFVAVIGPDWLTVADSRGRLRPLDSPKDYVRLEIAIALSQPGVRVIPLLVNDATMPRPEHLPEDVRSLCTRNALEISHSRFRFDISRLIQAIEKVLDESRRKAPEIPQHAVEWASISPAASPQIAPVTVKALDRAPSESVPHAPVEAHRLAGFSATANRFVIGVAAVTAVVAGVLLIPKVRTPPAGVPTTATATRIGSAVPEAQNPVPAGSDLRKTAPPTKDSSRSKSADLERLPGTTDSSARANPAAPGAMNNKASEDRPVALATVYIYRKSGEGFGKPSVFFNDLELARLTGNAGFVLRIPPGKVEFRVDRRDRKPLPLTLVSGQTYYLRSHYSFRRNEHLLVIDAKEGIADVKALQPLEDKWIFDHQRVLPIGPASAQ
jgi:hypothetical protein